MKCPALAIKVAVVPLTSGVLLVVVEDHPPEDLSSDVLLTKAATI